MMERNLPLTKHNKSIINRLSRRVNYWQRILNLTDAMCVDMKW